MAQFFCLYLVAALLILSTATFAFLVLPITKKQYDGVSLVASLRGRNDGSRSPRNFPEKWIETYNLFAASVGIAHRMAPSPGMFFIFMFT